MNSVRHIPGNFLLQNIRFRNKEFHSKVKHPITTYTDRQTDTETYTHTHTDRQAGRQADKLSYITHSLIYLLT